MRFLSALFILFSYFIAKYNLSIIVTLMSLSWGVIAGSFMARIFTACTGKKSRKPAP